MRDFILFVGDVYHFTLTCPTKTLGEVFPKLLFVVFKNILSSQYLLDITCQVYKIKK